MAKSESTPCDRCGGSGWVTLRGEDGYERTIRCECHLELERRRLYEHARIPQRHARCSISNLEPIGPDLQKAQEKARAFVEPYVEDGRGLLLMGPPGVGKTHLAVGIMKYLIEVKLVRSRFEEFRHLLQEIRHSYDPDSTSREEEILRPAMESPFLVLDDLGGEKPTGWVLDTLMLIIDHRYNKRLMTLVTTNYLDDPKLLQTGGRSFGSDRQEMTLADRIGVRLRSRLHEMCDTVLILGEDYRRRGDSGHRLPPANRSRTRSSR